MGAASSRKRESGVAGDKLSSSHSSNENQHKIVMIGDASVGKSSIVLRFVDNQFFGDGRELERFDFKESTLKVGGDKVGLEVWDTAGAERFRTITSSYYRGTKGVMIVFDLTNQKSFKNLEKWLLEVERYAESDVLKMILANKSDLTGDRFVSREELKEFCDLKSIQFLEVSAMSGENIEKAFQRLALNILERKELLQI